MIDTTVCPECDEVAEVLDRAIMESTDGPVEHAKILCVRRHWFFLPLSMLGQGGPVAERAASGGPAGASDRDGRLLDRAQVERPIAT